MREPDPTPTIVRNSCTWCDVEFKGATDAEVEREVAAHRATCERKPLEPGDFVRWEYPRYGKWAEGEIRGLRQAGLLIRILVSTCATGWDLDGDPIPQPGVEHEFGIYNDGSTTPTIRRIPRPEREVKAEAAPVYGFVDLGTQPLVFHDWRLEYPAAPVPKPVELSLIDGLSPMKCYEKWCTNRSIVERGGEPLYRLTPAQIAAGRLAYQRDALADHAGELRAKLAESAEKERRVVVLDQEID